MMKPNMIYPLYHEEQEPFVTKQTLVTYFFHAKALFVTTVMKYAE